MPTKKFLRYRRCAIHARFVAVSYWDFHVFMIPRHNGDRASPSPGAPFQARCAPLPTALFFLIQFLPPLLLYHVSLAGRVPYGVAATLASVISEDLAAVARWKGEPRLGRYVPQTVPASELFSRYRWSPCTLVNPGLSTSRVNTHVGHIFHHTEKPTTSY